MELVDMNSLGLFDLKILSVQVGFTLHTHSKLNTFFSRLVPAPAPVPVLVLVPKSAFLSFYFTWYMVVISIYSSYCCFLL